MADLLQRVFEILVRPHYVDQGNNVFYKGAVYGPLIPLPPVGSGDGKMRYALDVLHKPGVITEGNSPVKLNASGHFSGDVWFLHSTHTSYDHVREEMKTVIADYGTDNVRVAIHVPIDYSILPDR